MKGILAIHRFLMWATVLWLAAGCAVFEPDVSGNTAVSPNAITAATANQITPLYQLGEGVLTQLALNPVDGGLFIGTSLGVYLYDGATAVSITPNAPRDFFPTEEPVAAIALAPDGQVMAIVTRPSNQVQFWQIQEHRLLHTFSGGSVQFAPGGTAVVGGSDGAFIVDAASGTEKARFAPPDNGQFKTPQFSPDASLVAVPVLQDEAGFIQLWPAAGGQLARILLPPGQMQLTRAAFSPDGSLIGAVGWDPAADKSEQLVVWALADEGAGQVLQAPAGILGSAWAIAPDSNLMAAGLMDGSVALWSRDGGDPIQLLKQESSILATAVAFSVDGERLVVGRVNGRVETWHIADGILEQQMDLQSKAILQLLPRPDATGFVVVSEDGRVAILDEAGAQTGQALIQYARGAVESVAFTADGAVLAAGSASGGVRLWDLATKQLINELPDQAGAVQSLAFAPQTDLLALGLAQSLSPQQYDDSIHVWRWPENELVQQFGGEKEVVAGCSSFRSSVVYSPDGRFLVNGSHNFTAEVRDAATGERRQLLDAHQGTVYDVAFSPDSRFLATAAEDGFVRVWRTDTFEQVAQMINGIDGVTAVSFSPDGRYLASSTLLGTIDLWDTASWGLLHSIPTLKNRFSRLVFSPDGSLLAAGVNQDEIQLWAVDSLAPVKRLEGWHGKIEALAFSPDGALLAAGSSAGIVQMWGIASP